MATKRKAAPKKKAAAKKRPVKRASKGGPSKGARRAAPGRKGPAARRAAPAKKPAAPKAAPPAPTAPDTSRPLALAVAMAGLAKKAEDVLLLDVRGLSSYADYFVVMTADSDRQAGAIADHVDEELKKAGVSKVGVEGYEAGRWILVDYGDVVAHVMSREAREFYDLEGLWADAPRAAIEG